MPQDQVSHVPRLLHFRTWQCMQLQSARTRALRPALADNGLTKLLSKLQRGNKQSGRAGIRCQQCSYPRSLLPAVWICLNKLSIDHCTAKRTVMARKRGRNKGEVGGTAHARWQYDSRRLGVGVNDIRGRKVEEVPSRKERT